MRRGYAMVIYGYEAPGGALNLTSTTLPRPWSPWVLSPFRKNPHGRAGNRTRDLMISSQRLRPLDHEAGQITECIRPEFNMFCDYIMTLSLHCIGCVRSAQIFQWYRRHFSILGARVVDTKQVPSRGPQKYQAPPCKI